MTSIANGVPNSNESKKPNLVEEQETIDFLHFIRYMNIVYKSDANMRLKFLYGISMIGTVIYLFFSINNKQKI